MRVPGIGRKAAEGPERRGPGWAVIGLSAEEVGSPGREAQRFCLPEGGPAPAGSPKPTKVSHPILGFRLWRDWAGWGSLGGS